MIFARPNFTTLEEADARRLIELALDEDGARRDITTSLSVTEGTRTEAVIRSRQNGVLSGLPCVSLCLKALGGDFVVEEKRHDGESLASGEVVARLDGPLALLLSAETVVLPVLMMESCHRKN